MIHELGDPGSMTGDHRVGAAGSHEPRRRGGRPTTRRGSRMSLLVHKGGLDEA
jgi:hypothetical protein